jgi:hypothetical protein
MRVAQPLRDPANSDQTPKPTDPAQPLRPRARTPPRGSGGRASRPWKCRPMDNPAGGAREPKPPGRGCPQDLDNPSKPLRNTDRSEGLPTFPQATDGYSGTIEKDSKTAHQRHAQLPPTNRRRPPCQPRPNLCAPFGAPQTRKKPRSAEETDARVTYGHPRSPQKRRNDRSAATKYCAEPSDTRADSRSTA